MHAPKPHALMIRLHWVAVPSPSRLKSCYTFAARHSKTVQGDKHSGISIPWIHSNGVGIIIRLTHCCLQWSYEFRLPAWCSSLINCSIVVTSICSLILLWVDYQNKCLLVLLVTSLGSHPVYQHSWYDKSSCGFRHRLNFTIFGQKLRLCVQLLLHNTGSHYGMWLVPGMVN